MEPHGYLKWQELHRRTVRGESRTLSEQETYEAGCCDLDADESLDGSADKLRQLREQISSATLDQRELQEQEAKLDARIATLESRLDERTRLLLGILN